MELHIDTSNFKKAQKIELFPQKFKLMCVLYKQINIKKVSFKYFNLAFKIF
jgi:hypothetical protein